MSNKIATCITEKAKELLNNNIGKGCKFKSQSQFAKVIGKSQFVISAITNKADYKVSINLSEVIDKEIPGFNIAMKYEFNNSLKQLRSMTDHSLASSLECLYFPEDNISDITRIPVTRLIEFCCNRLQLCNIELSCLIIVFYPKGLKIDLNDFDYELGMAFRIVKDEYVAIFNEYSGEERLQVRREEEREYRRLRRLENQHENMR